MENGEMRAADSGPLNCQEHDTATFSNTVCQNHRPGKISSIDRNGEAKSRRGKTGREKDARFVG